MGGRVDPKDTWWEKNTADNMRDVDGTDELLAALADAGERLVIVDFYARWCGACRALYPKLCKIAAANPEVVFLKVEFDDNREMCRSMGVKVLPYFHLYRGAEGKVASFSASISKVGRLREAIEEHAPGSTGGSSRDASKDESRDRGAHFALRRPRRRLIRVCTHRARGRRSSDGDEGETTRVPGNPSGRGRERRIFFFFRAAPFASCCV